MAVAKPTLLLATSKWVQKVLMKASPRMKASPSWGGRSNPIMPTMQTDCLPSWTCRMQSFPLRVQVSPPIMKSRLGRVGTMEQSTCFCLPDPNPLVISSTTLVGPTRTDVPVSTIPMRFPTLQLVPLKMRSSIAICQQSVLLRGQYLNSPVQYLVLTPPKTRADPFEPGMRVRQKENELPTTWPCWTKRSKMRGRPLTEMRGQAMPRIPSNLEARKLTPWRAVIWAKREFLAGRPANQVVSCPTKPETAPEPQVMLKWVPLQTQVELLAESKYL